MSDPLAKPRLLGSTVLVLLIAVAALVPARVLAAPVEGPGSPPTTLSHCGRGKGIDAAKLSGRAPLGAARERRPTLDLTGHPIV